MGAHYHCVSADGYRCVIRHESGSAGPGRTGSDRQRGKRCFGADTRPTRIRCRLGRRGCQRNGITPDAWRA